VTTGRFNFVTADITADSIFNNFHTSSELSQFFYIVYHHSLRYAIPFLLNKQKNALGCHC